MTVVDGWTVDGYRGSPDAGGVTRNEGKFGVSFVIVDNPVKACDGEAEPIDPPLGPTVDDLATYLARLPSLVISEESDVALAGHRGEYFAYTKLAREIECGCCGMGTWPTNSQRDIDEYNEVWILDIDGIRLVIDAITTSGPSGTVMAELRQAVESIQIGP